MDGKKLEYRGEEALRELERLTMDVREVQEGILKEILEMNGRTEYLRKYMEGSTDVIQEFKRRVPVITYSEIHPYIHRITNGEDHSIISGHPITEMLISSGTSGGEPKLMPSIAEDLDRRTYLYNLIMPIMNQYIHGLDEGKAMHLLFVKVEVPTPSGLPARPVLTSYYKSRHFRHRSPDPFNDYTSPIEAILCPDIHQSMYCQLLAGLFHRRCVLRLGAVFASALLRSISFLEHHWPDLCTDIRNGTLNPSITDPDCRSVIQGTILASPNPLLADEVEAICRCVSWKGILCRLWPEAKYIEAVLTGTMAQYIPALELYTGGKIPLICTMYASSECYFGVNMKPMCEPADVVYTILPNMAYFEFIPVEDEVWFADEDREVEGDVVVGLADVKVGGYYELVVTTFAGLYRYRVGDVLQVRGFYHHAPQFQFICRRNVMLSIDTEKTSEEDLHRSITMSKRLLEPYDHLLVEYTGCADTSSIPGHYVLFWEIKCTSDGSTDPVPASVIQECCAVVEGSLNYVYRRCRSRERSIKPLEIRIVEKGAFEALMDWFVGHGGSINQYKTPTCIESSDALELLNSKVRACFFSPRDPIWNP